MGKVMEDPSNVTCRGFVMIYGLIGVFVDISTVMHFVARQTLIAIRLKAGVHAWSLMRSRSV